MKKLIYIGDPMCSWCYGFAPVISHIRDTYSDRLDMTLMLGGLYTDGQTYQDEKRITFLKKTWKRISDLSGQPFDFTMLESTGWLYDTELSCRAVVAVRRIAPDKTFRYFEDIQTNFYAKGWDSQSEETFNKAAVKLDINPAQFLNELRKPGCIEETKEDFLQVKRMGVSGYPTVLLNDHNGWATLTTGYQELAVIDALLKAWLEES